MTYPVSKAALNMVTARYAKELSGTPVKVNAANPGYCATAMNGHSGFRSAAEAASASVLLGHPVSLTSPLATRVTSSPRVTPPAARALLTRASLLTRLRHMTGKPDSIMVGK